MKELSPICLFTYNRLDETKDTVIALKNNFLACKSELFIFSDGWRNESDKERILLVRDFLKTIDSFKKVTIFESETNLGLANSVIKGVTKIVKHYGRIIVLEDDLVTTPNFLNFMNQALDFYENDMTIFSISGYTMDLPSLKYIDKDYYVGYRASSWGWGTWCRSWVDIDWEISDYKTYSKSRILQRKFRKGGNDLPRMLKNQMTSKIDSWAVRWCYNQFRRNQFTVFTTVSKVKSIGIGENATHTKSTTRFDTDLDKSNKQNFQFDFQPFINKKLMKEFKFKFSLLLRSIDKLLTTLKMLY